jgi:hypothetical protein
MTWKINDEPLELTNYTAQLLLRFAWTHEVSHHKLLLLCVWTGVVVREESLCYWELKLIACSGFSGSLLMLTHSRLLVLSTLAVSRLIVGIGSAGMWMLVTIILNGKLAIFLQIDLTATRHGRTFKTSSLGKCNKGGSHSRTGWWRGSWRPLRAVYGMAVVSGDELRFIIMISTF